MYNSMLSIYFLVTVRYNWKDVDFTKYIEKPMLLFAILLFFWIIYIRYTTKFIQSR